MQGEKLNQGFIWVCLDLMGKSVLPHLGLA